MKTAEDERRQEAQERAERNEDLKKRIVEMVKKDMTIFREYVHGNTAARK